MRPEEPILADALERPPAEREAFLARACGDDAALRARVDALLHAYAGAGVEIEVSPLAPVVDVTRRSLPAPPSDYRAGMRIGRYKLLQQLGEGGCGVVFLAEQEEPVRRRVALKVIKLGMDTREVIARFEAERQALALMDHPNIAHVLDAGATESGRPFFVMELVRGIPITRHCDENNLGPRDRLQLFVQVCAAVQHAHQKGIIHRDLKPSNILVTLHDGVPVPKIIDFGIAKAMHGRLTDLTVFTAFEQFIGTPAYMSPEQTEMSGLDVDTRSDIYSLGVLLYEMLTGHTPFETRDLLRDGLDQMRRAIREKEPPKPSTRLGTLDAADRAAIAKHRGTDGAKLRSWLRGDLDWIVMRCLEKDRRRRYETANGLAMDIRRHLANEPIVARPPSTAYVLRKLVRRNKLSFAAAAVVFVTLVVGFAFSTWSFLRERAARELAQVEAVRSAQVARFMQDMLAGVGPQVALGRDTKLLRAILDETVERLPRELRGQPAVEAGMRETLGNVYRDLGELRSAVLMHETALQMRRELYGAENVAVAAALANLGETLARQDRLAEAEAKLREALALRERLLGVDDPSIAATRAALINVQRRAGKPSQAGEAFDMLRRDSARPPVATGTDAGARPPPAAGLPLVIRIATTGGRAGGQPFGSGSFLVTARQQGVLEKDFSADGIQIEWIPFQTGPEANEAFARGLLDFAQLGDLGFVSARVAGIRQNLILATAVADSGYVVVRSDSPFRSLADLKGRRFGTVKRTAHHLKLCRLLEKQGFRESDYELRDFANGPAILAALDVGEVDGHLMSVPFDLEARSVVRVIYDTGRDPDLAGAGGICVSEGFASRYPAVVQRVVTALVKTAAWNSDEANRDAVFRLWSESDRSYEALTKSWAGFTLKERLSPLLDEWFFARLRRSAADAKRFGISDDDVDVGRFEYWAAPQYLQHALAELQLETFWPVRDANGQPVAGGAFPSSDSSVEARRAKSEALSLSNGAKEERPDPVPSPNAAAADLPLVIRIASPGGRYGGQPFNAGSYFFTARQQRVLEKEFAPDGIPIEWLTFRGGEADEAMARGRIDFLQRGETGYTRSRAAGGSTRLLLALPDSGQNFVVVRADSPFRALADLKGRRFGTIKGTWHHLRVCRLLEIHGFRQNDYEVINFESGGTILTALETGDIDGHLMSVPFDLEARGVLRVIHDTKGDPDLVRSAGFCVTEEFASRYPKIVQRVVTALVRTAAWNSDEANREAVFRLWSESDRSYEALTKSWAGVTLKERLSPLLDDWFFARLQQSAADAKRFGISNGDDGDEVVERFEDWAEPKYLQRALEELNLQGFWSERDAEDRMVESITMNGTVAGVGIRAEVPVEIGAPDPGSSRLTYVGVSGESVGSPNTIMPGDVPSIIRIAHSGGLPSGGSRTAGNVLTTVHQLGALEREFAPDGIAIRWEFFAAGGSATNEALARGVVDFGFQTSITAIPGRAAGLRQKLLMRLGGNGVISPYVIVRADSPFRTLHDLKGRRFATVKGTAGHFGLLEFLSRHGFKDGEFELVNYDTGSGFHAGLLAGEVDARMALRPLDEAEKGLLRVVHDTADDPPLADDANPDPGPRGAFLFWVSEEFELRYPAVVQRVVNVVVRTAAWNSDEKNREAVFELRERAGWGRDEIDRSWVAIPLKQRYSPHMDESFHSALRRSIEDARKYRAISPEAKVSIDGWAEPKYLQRALAELGLQDFWPEFDAAGRVKAGN